MWLLRVTYSKICDHGISGNNLTVIPFIVQQGLEKLKKHVHEPAGLLSEGEKSAWVAEKGKEVDREAFKIYCFKAKAVSTCM